ncbi:uncharacterized protein LOC129600719 [Paramacrobiotus metropolitanus]|uniref:uncharacterized protein LOC129600719 n=1 Tax=Paramacrobiotus metropolitanus TaxID=2943436 RepID=UPI0024459E4D|nr:uncharacterized protein LOC129600719 [Paramacrobiotus metropolitanus]
MDALIQDLTTSLEIQRVNARYWRDYCDVVERFATSWRDFPGAAAPARGCWKALYHIANCCYQRPCGCQCGSTSLSIGLEAVVPSEGTCHQCDYCDCHNSQGTGALGRLVKAAQMAMLSAILRWIRSQLEQRNAGDKSSVSAGVTQWRIFRLFLAIAEMHRDVDAPPSTSAAAQHRLRWLRAVLDALRPWRRRTVPATGSGRFRTVLDAGCVALVALDELLQRVDEGPARAMKNGNNNSNNNNNNNNLRAMNKSSDNVECPVCGKVLGASATGVAATPCGHVFCWSCVCRYVAAKGCCAVCRTPCSPSRLFMLQNATFSDDSNIA